jgi:ATP-dependent helicase HrpA
VTHLWNELEAAIENAMPGDRFRLRRRLRELRAAAQRESANQQSIGQLHEQVERSIELRSTRRANVPRITYDSGLPIFEKREEIAAAIRESQVVIICGETGSGKSTQIPKICLEIGRGVDAMIGHTQPRRIAARTIAARIAQELNVTLGQEVGYQIRFADRSRPETYIKVMTDGILLAETQGDRFLDQYDTLIIDEAHERSLNVDFLLGYLKRLLPRRPGLRVIITSATLDASRFASHFSSPTGIAPVIQVSGRTYPVEVRYRPLVRGDEDTDIDQQQGIVKGVEELIAAGHGDILVFLPTERDIRETARTLRGWLVANQQRNALEILPLYARLTFLEQQRIFAPHSRRRVVLATNVAESSLTVPGIHYVIDTGTARISRYSPRAKVQRLPIEAISQASAEQRKGRCGRLAPGICIRLYGEDDFLARDRYTTPEIRRTNLSAVILQTKALKLGEIEQFPFIDPPRPEAIRDGYNTLFEIGAVTEARELTELGRALSRLPVDPRIGRMVLAAEHENSLHEVIVIAAALELQDPRERPVDKQQAADEAHRRFADENSDFLSYLKLWDFYHQLKENLSRNRLRKA